MSVKWGEISRGEISNSTPRLNVALARLVDLKAALLAETSARGPTRDLLVHLALIHGENAQA